MQILLRQKWKSWERQDQEATRLRLKQERGRRLKICARKREKSEWVFENMMEEARGRDARQRHRVTWGLRWGKSNSNIIFQVWSDPNNWILRTDSTNSRVRGTFAGVVCVVMVFRHLAELRLNEQSSYNTREIQTAETLARTWKDQPSFFITEC